MDKQRVRKYKMRKRTLTKRIYASICLLLVCVLLVTATTYAWLILSRAPEVTDITATIGANGNLEMALTTTEHLTALKANDMYDDENAGFEFTNGNLLHDNVLWGNLVDLNSSDYGLSTLHMRPAILNVLNGYVADAPISMVTYGSDGRTEDLSLDPTDPNIDTLGFSGVYNVNKGGYYAGSVAMSMDDLQSGNYDKEALVQSVLDSRDYGVRIAGPLDFAGSVNQDQTQANIDLMVDGYCFAIDLLFRTNATEANLLLQTDGIQRVDDEDYEYILDFSGNGSYVEIPNKKLCTAIRVVFADTVTGEVYALAQPDLQGKLWMTARFDENGNPVAVKPGDAAVIKPLVENQVSAVTAWVFLDGTQVDNSYAAAVTNVAMKMNLQFATDMDLTPGHPDGNGTNGPPQLAYVGDTYVFGTYEQDNDTENGQEPIEWTVLAVNKNKALLISKYSLNTMTYHDSPTTTWENSTLRQWLGSTFLSGAFTAAEQEALVNTTMNPTAGRDDRIYDKVFLLSDAEVKAYFEDDSKRVAGATPYAGGADAVQWWTRGTLDGRAEGVYVVLEDGTLSAEMVDTDAAGIYIRPAMWIDLSISENIPDEPDEPDEPTEPDEPDTPDDPDAVSGADRNIT